MQSDLQAFPADLIFGILLKLMVDVVVEKWKILPSLPAANFSPTALQPYGCR